MTIIQAQPFETFIPEILGYEIKDAIAARSPQCQRCIAALNTEVATSLWDLGETIVLVRLGEDEWRGRFPYEALKTAPGRAEIGRLVATWHEDDVHAFEYAGN